MLIEPALKVAVPPVVVILMRSSAPDKAIAPAPEKVKLFANLAFVEE